MSRPSVRIKTVVHVQSWLRKKDCRIIYCSLINANLLIHMSARGVCNSSDMFGCSRSGHSSSVDACDGDMILTHEHARIQACTVHSRCNVFVCAVQPLSPEVIQISCVLLPCWACFMVALHSQGCAKLPEGHAVPAHIVPVVTTAKAYFQTHSLSSYVQCKPCLSREARFERLVMMTA